MASGLFAKRGLEVELFEPVGGPANVERVASGELDFCLTSVSHFLHAQRGRMLAARFVAIVVQRSPIAALVRADSEFWAPADLDTGLLGAPADSGLTTQYQAALAYRGLPPSVLVPMPYGDAPGALGRGEIDIVPDFIDLLPRTRRQAGVALRAVAVGPETYASGLVASDSVTTDLALQMRGATVAVLERQRDDPSWGLATLCERYPDVEPADALEGWSLVEPNIFTGAPVGSMDPARWAFTLDHCCMANGIELPPAGAVYRSEFLTDRSDPGQRQATASLPISSMFDIPERPLT